MEGSAVRKKLALATVLALLVTGAVVASVAAASPSGSPSGSSALRHPWAKARTAAEAAATEATPAGATRLVVIGIDLDFAFVDVGPKGETPGDYVVLSHRVFNEAGKRIGFDHSRCMVMFRGGLYCEGDTKIDGRGSILFAGNADGVVPVTGGDGEFKKARGHVRFVGLPNGAKLIYTLFL
jgi:hypothetical protein